MFLNVFEIFACKECSIKHSFKLIAEEIDVEDSKNSSLLREINEQFINSETVVSSSQDELEVPLPVEFPDHLKNIQVVQGKLVCEKKKYFLKIEDGIIMGLKKHPLSQNKI